MGTKTIPLIEKKRIVDEITALKKKMKINDACKSIGVTVNTYWNHRRHVKEAGMMGKPNNKRKICETDPLLILKESNAVIKLFLQDATFILSEGSFEFNVGYIGFTGTGTIKIDNK